VFEISTPGGGGFGECVAHWLRQWKRGAGCSCCQRRPRPRRVRGTD